VVGAATGALMGATAGGAVASQRGPEGDAVDMTRFAAAVGPQEGLHGEGGAT
jgi:hypothetical protein